MGINNKAIVLAYEKGYRVKDDGKLLNLKGKVLKPLMAKNRKYPTFNFLDGDKRYCLRIHRLAAYCFYGEEVFKESLVVRHLNSNVMDFSKNNIALGTQAENVNDMPEETKNSSSQKKKEWCLKTGKVPPPQYKWSEKEIKAVIELLSKGYSTRKVGSMLNIPSTSVWNIKNREGNKKCK